MNFTCQSCERRYSIADEKVRGKSVKVRCKNCQNVILVEGPSVEENTRVASMADVEKLRDKAREEESAPPRAAPAAAAQWFVIVKGKQEGPLDVRGVGELVTVGTLTDKTYAWRQGMPEWKRVADVPELAGLLAPHPSPDPSLSMPWNEGPAAPAPAQASALPASELFSDLDLPAHRRKTGETPLDPGDPSAPETDPFATFGAPGADAPPGEATRFFIAQAGMNKRNPPWKIALFVALVVMVPVSILYLLSELQVVPLQITRVNEQGEQVKESVFSVQGVSGLKSLLMGENKKPKAAPKRKAAPKVTVAAAAPEPTPAPAKVAPLASPELTQLYAPGGKADVGPRVREDVQVVGKDSEGEGGPPPEEIQRVVGQTQTAFQQCIEQELRTNPAFKGGKINLMTTVGSSGTVKKTIIDRADIEQSGLGACLKQRAKRMVFSAFSGEDVDLEIPLILTGRM